MQLYGTVPSRNLIRAEAKMLRHAEAVIVLGKFGVQKEQPLNKTDTVVYRRLVPFGAVQAANPATGNSNVAQITPTNFILSEGVTPNANTISYQDVTTTLQNFGVLFKFSSKTQLMYEDDVPGDMAKLTGETMGEIAEKVRYGAIKGGLAVIYANGTTRVGLNTSISINKVRLAVRALQSNRAMRVTSMLAPSPNFGTRAVQPGYICFSHTDTESDIRLLPNFTRVEDYGSYKPLDPSEIGSVERVRFMTSPLFDPFLGAGAAVAGTGMKSAGGANVDVYPFIVCAEDAWGQVALKGHGAMTPVVISATQRNHANPMGQFGYVGADMWINAVRLNENFMLRIEAGVTDL